jgi:ABC-2 type transport system permease protein
MQIINPAAPRFTWLEKYYKAFELGFQFALEYRINFLISLISAVYPIIIQSFLWAAIFQSSDQPLVYGFTFRQMIAYTFMAGLVTRLVRTGFEYEIMDDVKTGKYSRFLVQPLGYFPYRVCSFFGQKLPGQVMILAILALVMTLLVTFWGASFGFARIIAFLVAILLATALNFLIFYCISAMAFWIVDVGFLFEGIRIVTVLLAGGIFPLQVFGETFNQISNWLPFKYTVNYPINVLNGMIPPAGILQGMLIQILWIGICLVLSRILWQVGSRRYVAVGG